MDGNFPIYRFDDVRVEPGVYKVWKAEHTVQLEPKAFEVLLFLIENRGRLIRKQELLEAVWKDAYVTENALTREIAQLRKGLGEEARNAKYIETVPTRGYRFIADVTTENRTTVTELPIGNSPAQYLTDIPLPTAPFDQVKPVEAESGRYGKRHAIVLFGIAALIGLFAFLFWQVQRNRAGSEAPGVRKLTQITSSKGLDFYPSLSPDGSSVAYSSDQNGNFEIYVKQLAPGGRELQITSDGEQNLQPAWSPDGQYIAYFSRNRGGIWVIPAFGGSARRLTEFGSKPSWSRDGSMIAFQSAALTDLAAPAAGAMPPSTIWTIPASGGSPRQVTQMGVPSGGHGAPLWSPDGKRIVFVAFDANLSEAWSVSSQGGEPKRLAANSSFSELVISPDGKYVYLAGGGMGPLAALWRMPISESGEPLGEPVKVESLGSTPIRHLSISANGNRIAYSTLSMTSDIWAARVSPETGESEGEPIPLMQDTSRRKTNPAFSPDGQKIAFGIWRPGVNADIWLMDADGGNPHQVTTEQFGGVLANWITDSDHLGYVVFRERRQAFASLDLKTGRQQIIGDLGQGFNFHRVSPDGTMIASHSRSGGPYNIWTKSLQDGDFKQLTFDNEGMGFPSWSPDGKFLAIELKRGDDTHIATMSKDGGAVTQLTFDRGQSWPHSWSPDGQKITFAGFRNGYWNIWWVSIKDRTQKQLTGFSKPNAYVRYPAWSPRGDRIVFEYAETTGNIWVADLK